MSEYKIVSIEGRTTDPRGQMVTLEKKEPKNRIYVQVIRKKKTNTITAAIIAFIFAFFLSVAVACYLDSENAEKAPKTERRIEIARLAPVDVPQMTKEFDVFDEAIPLSADLQKALYDASEEFGVPYDLALAVVWKETNFTNVMGDGGRAYGYFQIWPRWHGDRMAELGVTDLNDPNGNFRVGCSILGDLLETYGDEHKALMAYNMGPSGAGDLWAQGYTSSGYSRAVMNYMEGLS